MDTLKAAAIARANAGKERMVFDWNKAAKIIRERKAKNAYAGLERDFEYTGGDILIEGKIPDDSYTYLASNWATPQLVIGTETIDCFIMENQTDWDSDTYWPESAKLIAGI